MPFLPKKHFRWREPKVFTKLNDAFERSKARWWSQPLVAVVGAALLMVIWFIALLDPQKEPLPFIYLIPLAAAGGVFFAYIVPWLVSLCPSEVHLYDSYLFRVRGNSNLQIRYTEIETFSWGVGDGFFTLILTLRRKQQRFLLGAPSDVPRDAVTQFLLDRNVPLEPKA